MIVTGKFNLRLNIKRVIEFLEELNSAVINLTIAELVNGLRKRDQSYLKMTKGATVTWLSGCTMKIICRRISRIGILSRCMPLSAAQTSNALRRVGLTRKSL